MTWLGCTWLRGTKLQPPREGRGTSPGDKGKGWRAGEAGRAVQGCAVKDTKGVSCFLSDQVRNWEFFSAEEGMEARACPCQRSEVRGQRLGGEELPFIEGGLGWWVSGGAGAGEGAGTPGVGARASLFHSLPHDVGAHREPLQGRGVSFYLHFREPRLFQVPPGLSGEQAAVPDVFPGGL